MLFRISFLLALTASFALANSEENVRQDLDAAPGENLVVDVSFGNVEVAAGSGNKATIEAHRQIEMRDEQKEKEFLAEAPITISKDGNTIFVGARREKNKSWSWSGSMSMDARYTIHVPKNFNVDLRTGGGCVTASELNGNIKASTSGGELRLTQLRGPVDARTSGGDIKISDCIGALEVKTSGGGIRSTAGGGSLDARTSGGSIVVRDFKGDTLVKTSGGQLTFENIGGKVVGQTSGGSISAALISPLPGEVDLASSAGSISLNIPVDAALTIEARASSGSVSSSLPIATTRFERDELHGTMNGGGKSVTLRASAGSISLRPAGDKTAMQ